MKIQIKAALDLLATKGQVKLSYLGKTLDISENDNKSLTEFLIAKNLIHEFNAHENPFGREYHYELTDAGEKLRACVQFFNSLDRILSYMVQHPHSQFSIQEFPNYMNVPDMQREYKMMLVDEMQVLAVKSEDKTHGKNYGLTERGMTLYAEGGFTELHDAELYDMFAEFIRNGMPLPRTENERIVDLHDDMLLTLKRKDEQFPGEWVDLLAYYPNMKENYVREVVHELKKHGGLIDVKVVGPLGITGYGQGRVISSARFPNPVHGKITYAGKRHLQSLNQSVSVSSPISITGERVNFVNGAHGTVTDNTVDNSDYSSRTETKSETTKVSTAKKITEWAGAAGAIIGAGAKAFKE